MNNMPLDTKKTILCWSLYDWANSAFATTVMAAFFPIFFKEYWSAGADVNESTFKLGLANSLAGILVALSAPLLGAIADRGTAKKHFLLFFAFLGVVMTCCLSLVAKGQWVIAVVLYVFATVGFSGGNIFYDGLLPGVASKAKMNSVSALGFSLGYLGGGVLFAVNVWMTLKPEQFGFTDAGQAVRFSFLTVGIWWAVFSIPIFLFVKEPVDPGVRRGWKSVQAGLKQLRDTLEKIRRLKTVFLFLIAYWFYIDGVDTIIRMASDYGLALGFERNHLIAALLLVQFIGFPAAIAYGYLGNKIGVKRSIYIAIGMYLIIAIWASFIHSIVEFYILAVMIALIQGGIQALSRSFYANMIPVEKAGEFFGFYNMLGKFAVVLGPILIGSVGLLVKSFSGESLLATRISISSVSLLFIAGGILFFFVKEENAGKEFANLSS
jgi:UMF1 family MFS transporter